MIGIIGHFMFENPDAAVNGQTAKTRNYYTYLTEYYGEDSILTMDTNYFRKHMLKNYGKVIHICTQCKTIIILPTANGLKLLLPILWGLKKIYHFQLIYAVVGGWLCEFTEAHTMFRKLMSIIDHIYVESEFMARRLREKSGLCHAEKLPNFSMVRPLELDTNFEFLLNSDQIRFCTFSRVTEEKGIIEAMRSTALLNEKYEAEKCHLDIYGPLDSKFSEMFQMLLKEYPCCSYCGVLSGQEIVDILKNYYLMLFPTYYHGEGMPGAVIEAFSAGLPVVASDWHDNSEVILHGKCGAIYSLEDKTHNLVSTLLELIENREQVLKMHRNCLEESLKYAPDAVMGVIIEKIDNYA